MILEKKHHKTQIFSNLNGLFVSLDRPLSLMILMVFTISCFAVYSASHDDIQKFYQHLRNLFIALVLIMLLAKIPSVFLEKLAIPTYIATILLLLLKCACNTEDPALSSL